MSLSSSLYDSVILSLKILSYSCGLTWYMLLDLSYLTQTFLYFLMRSMSSLIFAWNVFLEFMNSIFRIIPNRSFSNWSSPLLLGGVLCDFNLLAPGFCSSFRAAGLRWKWAFHRILLITSTILFVKDRTKSCFPGNGMFFREYFGVNFSICMYNQYLLSFIHGVLNLLPGAIFLNYPVSVQGQ